MRISCWPMTPKNLQQTNRQDWVFNRPPGISEGAFQLQIDNIWFFKLLLLFTIEIKTEYRNRILLQTNRIFFQIIWRKIRYDFLRETSPGTPGRTESFAGVRWSALHTWSEGQGSFKTNEQKLNTAMPRGRANRATFHSNSSWE